MTKNRMIWLVLEVSFYLLLVALTLDFINYFIQRTNNCSSSLTEQIGLITHSHSLLFIEPLTESGNDNLRMIDVE